MGSAFQEAMGVKDVNQEVTENFENTKPTKILYAVDPDRYQNKTKAKLINANAADICIKP